MSYSTKLPNNFKILTVINCTNKTTVVHNSRRKLDRLFELCDPELLT